MAEILVIDDDPDILSLLFDTLSKAGHGVRTEPDGDSGLASAAVLRPDLVLLDWMMPLRSGLEVCHNLRSDRMLDDVPVVMLSARGTEADLEWGYAAGADAYIVKPFSPRALVWRIEAMLSKGRYPVIHAGPED
jgi:two-component system phosphate regulon response regulator PhoB